MKFQLSAVAFLAVFALVAVGCLENQNNPATNATATPGLNVSALPTISGTNGSGKYSLPSTAQLTGNASCSTGGKLQVLLYLDPYCPACVANEPKIAGFYDAYAGKADVQYRIVVTHARQMAREQGADAVYRALDYHVCADQQKKIRPFMDCFYAQLKTDGGDFLAENETTLRACAKTAGLDEDRLDACLPTARKKIDQTLFEAAGFGGGTFFTPMAVVDCRYRVNAALVEQTYCALGGACS